MKPSRLLTLAGLGFTLTFSGCGGKIDDGVMEKYIAELDSVSTLGYSSNWSNGRYNAHSLWGAGVDTAFANPLIRKYGNKIGANDVIIFTGRVDSKGKVLPKDPYLKPWSSKKIDRFVRQIN